MALSLQQGTKQTQKLALTRTMLQGIELLQLSNIELHERISLELLENPVLEEESGKASESVPEPLPAQSAAAENTVTAPDKGNSDEPEPDESIGIEHTRSSGARNNFIESLAAGRESLTEHLLWQARLSDVSDDDLAVHENIITSLDERGFLQKDVSGYAIEMLQDEGTIEKVLGSIRLFDPVGCAVRDVQESIYTQSCHYYPSDELLHRIVKDHFNDLENLNYEKIARELHVPLKRIVGESALIQCLDPYPGRQYSREGTNYVVPDIEVKIVDGEIIILLNDDWIPSLMINTYYINIVKKKNIEKNLKEYIQGKVQSARDLMKNISSRRETIIKVVNAIMLNQMDFLKKGPGHLKPLTHLDIAREIGMHESTVSRATSGKLVQTGWGTYGLKYFFVSRLKSDHDDASSDMVMMRIKKIVESEKKAKPLSDEEIVSLLKKEGIQCARRTVAKYREVLDIPSSRRRKKIQKIKSEGKV